MKKKSKYEKRISKFTKEDYAVAVNMKKEAIFHVKRKIYGKLIVKKVFKVKGDLNINKIPNWIVKHDGKNNPPKNIHKLHKHEEDVRNNEGSAKLANRNVKNN